MARKTVNPQAWRPRLDKLERDFPLVAHTEAGRTFSMVHRMKAEMELGIPLRFRSGFAISTSTGKATNEMDEFEWKQFYESLSVKLHREYPDLHRQIFG